MTPSSTLGELLTDATDQQIPVAPGAVLLRGFAIGDAPAIIRAVKTVLAQAPLRHMLTPGGHRMSVAMSNCGRYGWISDRKGYRYGTNDPQTGLAWPDMPNCLLSLARLASTQAGYPDFTPDACLINHYTPGAKMSLHQDRNERDPAAPIVSISLGLPATFLFGGPRRMDKTQRIPIEHGDVIIWGGPARLFFHGIAPLAQGEHPQLGASRINLTLRQAA